MAKPLADAACASLPPDALTYLAGLRARADVTVKAASGRIWVFWPAGDAEVVERLRCVRGAVLYCRHGDYWHRLGHQLPDFEVPADFGAQALPALLSPQPVGPQMDCGSPLPRVPVTLVRDDRPRPATALRCRLEVLAAWAEAATSRQLAALEGAACDGWVLLRGAGLPPVEGGERFCGGRVLVPLGFRPEPDLREGVLSAALGLGSDEVALLTGDGAELIPAGAFAPLTRASVRLAVFGTRG